MNNDHVGAMEWEWVWSMLQSKQGSTAGVAHEEVLAKAQQQVALHSCLQASVFADFAATCFVFLSVCLSVCRHDRRCVTHFKLGRAGVSFHAVPGCSVLICSLYQASLQPVIKDCFCLCSVSLCTLLCSQFWRLFVCGLTASCYKVCYCIVVSG